MIQIADGVHEFYDSELLSVFGDDALMSTQETDAAVHEAQKYIKGVKEHTKFLLGKLHDVHSLPSGHPIPIFGPPNGAVIPAATIVRSRTLGDPNSLQYTYHRPDKDDVFMGFYSLTDKIYYEAERAGVILFVDASTAHGHNFSHFIKQLNDRGFEGQVFGFFNTITRTVAEDLVPHLRQQYQVQFTIDVVTGGVDRLRVQDVGDMTYVAVAYTDEPGLIRNRLETKKQHMARDKNGNLVPLIPDIEGDPGRNTPPHLSR